MSDCNSCGQPVTFERLLRKIIPYKGDMLECKVFQCTLCKHTTISIKESDWRPEQ